LDLLEWVAFASVRGGGVSSARLQGGGSVFTAEAEALQMAFGL
jgi:hypothetical protein